MALGISFVPGQGSQQQQQAGVEPAGPPLQQALQLLSLRLPRVAGANAILPRPLLNGRPGGSPVPGTPEWDELMKRLLPGGGGSMPGGGAPPPGLTNPGWKYGGPPAPSEPINPYPGGQYPDPGGPPVDIPKVPTPGKWGAY